jgi:hypothetical protein
VSPGEPGRIRIFIIYPDLHPEAFPDRNGVAAEVEPFFGEIRRYQAGPGMDEDASYTVGFKIGQLGLDLLLGHPVVPDPERGAPELGGGVGESLNDGSIGIALRLFLTAYEKTDHPEKSQTQAQGSFHDIFPPPEEAGDSSRLSVGRSTDDILSNPERNRQGLFSNLTAGRVH